MIKLPPKPQTTLNKENYYDIATDFEYMSATIFKKFMKCEAGTLGQLKAGKWLDEGNVNLLMGNYVHSYFESPEAHETFIREHTPEPGEKVGPESLFTQKGQLRSQYKKCDAMIARLEADDFFKWLYQSDGCEKEVIVTGELFGTTWKGKIDCLNVEKGYFVDLKTTRGLKEMFYSNRHHGRVSWLIEYGYVLQMSIYKHLLDQKYGKPFSPYIFAVTKDDYPGIAGIPLEKEHEWFTSEDAYVKSNLPHVLDVLHGDVAPRMCHDCQWCHMHELGQNLLTIDQLSSDY